MSHQKTEVRTRSLPNSGIVIALVIKKPEHMPKVRDYRRYEGRLVGVDFNMQKSEKNAKSK